ncbi:MAG: hypothetical protein KGD63_04600 [Candidatus Lokiarchaeota archaeon]|nr:hypothetical protein [Candidatus Lokiarchaeota archaeon]
MINILFQESSLTLVRIITVYFVQGFLVAFFIYLVYKIIKRDRKRLNYIFSFQYIIPAIALSINFFYAPLAVESVVLILNFITTILTAFSTIFNLLFILILLKSEKVINTKKQILFTAIYCIALVMSIFIYYNPNIGITMNGTTNWLPAWKWPLFFYIIAIYIFYAVLPSYYYTVKVYRRFEDKDLKKKWRVFIIGNTALYTVIILIFLSNTLNIAIIRTIFSILSGILSILGAYGTYYGVLRQLE